MPFTKTPFKIDSFRANGFNPSPFSVTPFKLKSFKEKPFQAKPFDLTPFITHPFNNPNNNKIWTTWEQRQYLHYMRSKLPSKDAREYFNKQNEYQKYLKEQQEQSQQESMLSDYNKGTEINSLRDILLGANNEHMEHAIEEIPEWLGGLNIIPDTLKHYYNHLFKPLFTGQPLQAGLNLLMDLSETLDVLANPVKAVAQGIVNGDNVWENLVASTVGTEEGIKNFDWDTGNFVADLLLEIVSDPINWFTLGAGALKDIPLSAGQVAVKKGTQEAAQAATRQGVKTISKKLGKEITEEAYQTATRQGSKNLWKNMKDILTQSDSYKQYMKRVYSGELKTAKEKFKAIKEIWNINSWDSVQKGLKDAYIKGFAESLGTTYKLTDKEILQIIQYARRSGLTKTVMDLNQEAYDKLSKNILISLSRRGNFVDDAFTKSILKLELTPIGAYPAYRFIKTGKAGEIIQHLKVNRIIKTIVDAFAIANKAPGSFVKETVDSVDAQLHKNVYLSDLFAEGLNRQAVKDVAIQASSAFAKYIEQIKATILTNKLLTGAQKEARLLEVMKSLHPDIKNFGDIIHYIEELEVTCKSLGLQMTEQNSFKQFVNEFKRVFKHINLEKGLDATQKIIDINKESFEQSRLFMSVFQEIKDKEYTVTWIEKAIEQTKLLDALEQVTEMLDLRHSRMLYLEDYEILLNILAPFKKNAAVAEIIKSLKEVLKAQTVKGYIIEGELFYDTIRYNLKYAAKDIKYVLSDSLRVLITDETLYRKIMQTLRAVDKYKAEPYSIAKQALNMEASLQYKVRKYEKFIKDLDVQTNLKVYDKNAFKRVQVFNKVVKDGIKGDIIFYATGEEIKKGTQRASKIILDIEKKHGGVYKLFRKTFKKLEDMGVNVKTTDLLTGQKTNTPISDAMEEMYEKFLEVNDLLYSYQENLIGPDFESWYITLSDSIRKLTLAYQKYDRIFQKHFESPRMREQYDRFLRARLIKYFGGFDPTLVELLTNYAIKTPTPQDLIQNVADQLKRAQAQLQKYREMRLHPKNKKEAAKAVKELAIYEKKVPQIQAHYKQYKKAYERMLMEEGDLSGILQEFINSLDFKYRHVQKIIADVKTNLIFAQISKEASSAILNSNIGMRKLYSDKMFSEIKKHITDPQFLNSFRPAEKRLFITLSRYQDGLTNKNIFYRVVDTILDSVDDEKTRELLRNAIITSTQNLSARSVDKLNKDKIIAELINSIQGYVNSFNLSRTSKSMDVLREEYGLKTAGRDLITEELEKADIPLEVAGKEHSGLYDVASQIMVWEKEHPGEVFSGVMLDIETTGGMTKDGQPIGEILEIAMMTRGADGKLKVIAHSKVQDTLDNVTTRFMNSSDVIYSMGTTQAEHIARFVSTDKIVTPADVLQVAYDTLLKLPQATQVHTYNGNLFDIPYLLRKMKDERIGGELVESSKKRFINKKAFKQEQLYRFPNVDELVERINWVDDLAEKNTDLYKMDPVTIYQLENAITDHINSQIELYKYNKLMDLEGNYINPQEVRFFTELDGSFIREIIEALQEDKVGTYTNISETITNMSQGMNVGTTYENLDEVINKQANDVKDVIMVDDIDTITDQLNKLNIDDANIDPALRQILGEIKDAMLRDLDDISEINYTLKQYPILDTFFNPRNPDYIKDKHEAAHKALLKQLQAEGLDITGLEDKLAYNLTAMLNYGGQTFLAYKVYRPELLELIDTTDFLEYDEVKKAWFLAIDTRVNLEQHLRNLRREIDYIVNYDLLQEYRQEALEVLQILKKSKISDELKAIKIDDKNIKESWAHLQLTWKDLKFRAQHGVNTRRKASILVEKIRKEHPDLVFALDNEIAHISTTLKGQTLQFTTTTGYKDNTVLKFIQDYVNNRYLNRVIKKARALQHGGLNTRLVNSARRVSELRLGSYDKQKRASKLTLQYIQDGRDVNSLLYLHNTYCKLISTPEQLISSLLYDTTNRTMRIKNPLIDNVFSTPQLFQNFLMRADELKDYGIKMVYDERQRVITLTLEDTLDIRRSSKYSGEFRWLVNGKEIEPAVYNPLSKELFEKGYSSTVTDKTYRDALYDWYIELINTDPKFAGRTGVTHYLDDLKVVDTDPKMPHLKDLSKEKDMYIPYFKEDDIGSYSDILNIGEPRHADLYNIFETLSTKEIKHTAEHKQFAEFVLNSGLNLNDEIFKDVPLDELSRYLKANPDLVVAYFKDDPNAVGKVVLTALSDVSEKSLKQIKESVGATVLPWNVYVEAAGAINKFAYNSLLTETWYKLMQVYKRMWLMNPGVILRNAMDSTMKNFFEGRNPNQTIKSYADAHSLLIKYDDITKQIRKLDPHGRFKFDSIDEYFIKNNPGMDKETYLFLYQVMNNMGMNTMNTMVDGVFGAFMKPMAAIERTARLSYFLNLQGQGKQYSEIMRRIAETHFNYDLADSLGFIKAIIPFHTYTFSNLNYIMHLIEENASVLRHFLQVYGVVWDFDELDHDELEENISLQYQIMNGNIPLHLFGFEDKEITRVIETKYGPQLQTVKNNAVIKVGSSIIDGLSSFIHPAKSLKDKLAPPAKIIMDTATEYLATATGNFSTGIRLNYAEAEEKYERSLGSVSLQNLIDNPAAVIDLLPVTGTLSQRIMHKENGEYKFGSTTGYRTQNPVLDVLGMAGIIGATSRWGEFAKRPKTTKSKTKSSGYRYYRSARTYNSRYRFNRNDLYLYNILHPNAQHRAFSKIRSIPQYLYANMGRNSRGKSKVASWMDMNTRYKVKNTLKRMTYM